MTINLLTFKNDTYLIGDVRCNVPPAISFIKQISRLDLDSSDALVYLDC